ncbi:nucleoside triphosphate hydrolase [Celeribacter neptunius]|uniref:Fructokinase n=1 Tax=Celeribacter neptunius TaxID=588602 RepID=A0A1I3THA9_9RHOB|nr:nucleoside triphosphate hydrolase [Celeribacter neptunius]SFJ70010.1 fructokinase [Celeribacter neptunius]
MRHDSLHDGLIEQISAAPKTGRRKLIALAGAPASGKSTLAEDLAQALRSRGERCEVVPMDGFHLDNRVLTAKGLLPRKGAPETFDVGGFLALVPRLRHEAEIYIPIFERARDIAIAGAVLIDESCDTLILEGNYLLFDQPRWRDLAPLWDLSIRLDVPEETLRDRLIQRWLDHGLTPEDAKTRAEGNDLRNAQAIAAHPLPADVTLRS